MVGSIIWRLPATARIYGPAWRFGFATPGNIMTMTTLIWAGQPCMSSAGATHSRRGGRASAGGQGRKTRGWSLTFCPRRNGGSAPGPFSGRMARAEALDLLRRVLGRESMRRFSPSALESLATCPPAWFWARLMGLGEVPAPPSGTWSAGWRVTGSTPPCGCFSSPSPSRLGAG